MFSYRNVNVRSFLFIPSSLNQRFTQRGERENRGTIEKWKYKFGNTMSRVAIKGAKIRKGGLQKVSYAALSFLYSFQKIVAQETTKFL